MRSCITSITFAPSLTMELYKLNPISHNPSPSLSPHPFATLGLLELRPGGWLSGSHCGTLQRQASSRIRGQSGIPGPVTQENWSGLSDSLLTLGDICACVSLSHTRSEGVRSAPYASPGISNLPPCPRMPSLLAVALASSCLFTQDWLDGDESLGVDSARNKASRK